MAQQAVDLFPVTEDAMYGPIMVSELATVLALVGRDDDSIQQIEIDLSASGSPNSVYYYLSSPIFSSVVELPRFKALVDQAGS